jgi:hypothetical protein
MRTYPTSTANPNVPPGVFLIAETSAMSGEIIETFYATSTGDIFRVCDWSMSKPRPAYMNQVCKFTGDTPNIITARYESYFRKDN